MTAVHSFGPTGDDAHLPPDAPVAPGGHDVLPSRADRRGGGARRRAEPARSRGGALGDGRGLTAFGAVALLLLFGYTGAAIDLTIGTGLGIGFGVLFVVGCLVSAGRVHGEDLTTMLFVPPLAYAAVSVVAGLIRPTGIVPENLVPPPLDTALDIGYGMLKTAPSLAVGVVVTLGVVLQRRRTMRRAGRSRRRAAGNS